MIKYIITNIIFSTKDRTHLAELREFSWASAQKILSVTLSTVMPFGHLISLEMMSCLSDPSIPAPTILAWVPKSNSKL